MALLAAAAVVLVVGATGAIVTTHSRPPIDTLARDAIGDHWNCALKNRRVRTPVALAEAAQRFDSAYRVLLDAPPDETSTPNGTVRVVDRHSCTFGGRRFGHVVLEYRQHVVSLLVTADDEGDRGATGLPDVGPQLHGVPINGLSVASIHGAHHAIVLVSDLDQAELRQLSTTVSIPLVPRLSSGLASPAPRLIASF